MLKQTALCCLLFSASLIASEEKTTPNFSIGFGLVTSESMLQPKGAEVNPYLVPKFSIRAAQDHKLNQDWQLSSGISIDYSQADLQISTEQQASLKTRLENTGLWLDSKLSYQSFDQQLTPFVQVSVGKIYGEYNNGTRQTSDWQTGYKLTTGLEFNLTKGSTISFGIGASNIDSMQ